MVSDERAVKHLNPTLGSSLIRPRTTLCPAGCSAAQNHYDYDYDYDYEDDYDCDYNLRLQLRLQLGIRV